MLVPLPRDLGWVHPALLARSCGPAASFSSSIRKVAQFGTAFCGIGGRSRVPLSVGRVVLHPGRVSESPFGGGRFSEWQLEGEVAGTRRSWPIFQCPRKITGCYTGEGLGLTSAPKTLLGDVIYFYLRRGSLGAAGARGRLVRMLEELLRCSLAMSSALARSSRCLSPLLLIP